MHPAGRSARPGWLSTYFRRIAKPRQMDMEYTFWIMLQLCTSPKTVYRHTSYHKQTKHQWARDDPAFVVVMSVLVAAAATAYCVTYGDTVWHSLLTILSAVLVDFIALGCAVATACWMLANTFLLKRPGQHQTDQQVEWLYAFDVHCNSYLPLFLVLYVLQFFLSPILLARSLLGNLLACLLYALALSYYHYMSFLGYSALPFLERTEVFLWPIALILVAMPFALVSGFNPCRFTLGIYFG
ncbi:UNC-50 family protein [Haematococcus lacustris]